MSSSFPSFASFPEPEEGAPKRSQDKKQRRRRESERDKGRGHTKERRPRSRSSSRERRSKRDNDRERRDTKRRRRKDNERRWRPEDDEQDKSRQDRCLLAEGRDPESKPGMHLWFSDFKGDPLNLTLGTLYKGDVPKFRRAEREFFRQILKLTYLGSSLILPLSCRKACPWPPAFLRSPGLVAYRWSGCWSTRPSQGAVRSIFPILIL